MLIVMMTIESDTTQNAKGRLALIVEHWQPSLRRLCAGYEYTESRREELFQEILLALWRALPTFREDSSLRTWTFKVAHNVAARYASRASKERIEETTPVEWVHGSTPDSLDDQCDEKKATEMLSWLISRLKPLDRQIILLYLEELSQGEIADITGITRDNVSTRMHRIKDALRQEMNRRLR